MRHHGFKVGFAINWHGVTNKYQLLGSQSIYGPMFIPKLIKNIHNYAMYALKAKHDKDDPTKPITAGLTTSKFPLSTSPVVL